MTEEKNVLPQETLKNVTGGAGEGTCPHNRPIANRTCRHLNCPYCNVNRCDLYNKDLDDDSAQVIT